MKSIIRIEIFAGWHASLIALPRLRAIGTKLIPFKLIDIALEPPNGLIAGTVLPCPSGELAPVATHRVRTDPCSRLVFDGVLVDPTSVQRRIVGVAHDVTPHNV